MKRNRTEYNRKYRETHKARIKKSRHEYYLLNKKKIREKVDIYNAIHKDRLNKIRRERYARRCLENKESLASQNSKPKSI